VGGEDELLSVVGLVDGDNAQGCNLPPHKGAKMFIPLDTANAMATGAAGRLLFFGAICARQFAVAKHPWRL